MWREWLKAPQPGWKIWYLVYPTYLHLWCPEGWGTGLTSAPVSRAKSFRQMWAMMPAASASPSTLIMVRNRSLVKQGGQ
jgi:hypothetical protein